MPALDLAHILTPLGGERLLMMVTLLALAMLFDTTSGMNDMSALSATAIESRALSARAAFAMAALAVVAAQTLGHTAVARSIGTGIVTLPKGLSVGVAFQLFAAGLGGALLWNLLARRLGIPSSATHALVGSLAGAALAAGLPVYWGWHGLGRVLLALILSPVVGLTAGALAARVGARVFRLLTASAVVGLRWLTVAGLASQALIYGLNDAQRTMGVISAFAVTAGFLAPGDSAASHADAFVVPLWVRLFVAASIALGANVGSRRIFRTVGRGIFRVRIESAVESQVASFITVAGATALGAPVSSTQVLAMSIAGVGAAPRRRLVNWARVGDILLTWIITLPGAAAAGVATFWMLRALGAALGAVVTARIPGLARLG